MNGPDEMLAFARAVETGGFTAAAVALKLTPSAVSKIVTRLENRLGVRLLNRTTRKIALTPEGEIYFRRCQRILADIEDAEQAVAQSGGKPQGLLRVNTGVAFGTHHLVPVLPVFLARYPEVKIELTLGDKLVDLVEEGADVAVRMAPMVDSALIARRICEVPRRIVASPAYVKQHGRPKLPEDLPRHNCIGFALHPHLNEWPFRGPDGTTRIRVTGNAETNNADALYGMVLAGLGIGRFSEMLAGPDIRAGRLVALLDDVHDSEMQSLHALYPHRRFLSPKVEAFIAFLVETFAQQPPWTCDLRQR